MALTFVFSFLIGWFGGLRSLTAPAVVTWAAYLGWLKLDDPLAWMSTAPAVVVFSLLALVEFVVDKLPRTPPRTDPMGFGARMIGGALCGACIAQAGGQNAFLGGALGAIGGIAGCFGGLQARLGGTKLLGGRAFVAAVIEDAVAIVGSVLTAYAASSFHR